MAADQASAILVIGVLFVTYKIFDNLSSQYKLTKIAGYGFLILMSIASVNLALAHANASNIPQATELIYVMYMRGGILFVIMMVLFNAGIILDGLRLSSNKLINVFRK